ncbi:MAG: 30S ribosomal protein S6 [Melioribacteraceae bacterium]|nr:30S ribosomal protein S6 [Melioribacteraceae bacterium]
MATTHYESVVIINAALEDPQIEQAIASIQTNIKSTGGEITETEDWGRKRLAYNINNAKSGYYLITRFVGPPSMIKEFERTLKLDENVIRYITIALDKKALEYLKKVKKEQTEEKVAETEPSVEEKP